MDIQPHPEKWDKAIVTVYDSEEYKKFTFGQYLARLAHRPLVATFLSEVRSALRTAEPEFPHDIVVSCKQLGRIAGETLGYSNLYPDADEVAMTRQITDFFEERSRTEGAIPEDSPAEQA